LERIKNYSLESIKKGERFSPPKKSENIGAMIQEIGNQ
jgi:hypothetical protein